MPGPAVPLAVGGILLLAYLLGKKKDEPAQPGTLIDNTRYDDNGGGGYVPPKVEPAKVKSWTYTIVAGDTPLALAKSWTGQDSLDKLRELSDANPDLQRMEQTRVRYFTRGSDVSGDLASTGITSFATLPAGQPAGPVPLTPSSSSGTSYPNNPVDGSFGQWVEDGPHYPVLSPWNPGQIVKIPASWGDPQSSLTGAHELLA